MVDNEISYAEVYNMIDQNYGINADITFQLHDRYEVIDFDKGTVVGYVYGKEVLMVIENHPQKVIALILQPGCGPSYNIVHNKNPILKYEVNIEYVNNPEEEIIL